MVKMENLSNISTLFIAEIPFNIQENDLYSLFKNEEGFKSVRLRKDKNNNLVAFVEFENNNFASRAKEKFQYYKFGINDKGLYIQFSYNSKTTKNTKIKQENNHLYNNQNNNNLNNLSSFQFPSFFSPLSTATLASLTYPSIISNLCSPQLPSDANSTLFVEGIPLDATEREVSHIFRQWPGFQSLRIITRIKDLTNKQNNNQNNNNNNKSSIYRYNLCFVEFENKIQANFAMLYLQGYRFDKKDIKGLSISFAKGEKKDKKLLSSPPILKKKETISS
jgi:hypothetical protein